MNGHAAIASLAVCSLLLCGCQQDLVQKRVNKLVSTTTNLYYEQVLNNLAMTIERPDNLPYFGIPTQGTHTNARQYTGGYTPSWDLVGIATNPFRGRYFFDKQSSPLSGSVQNSEAFQLQPVSNPDKLALIQAIFQKEAGNPRDAELSEALRGYETRQPPFDYLRDVGSHWYCKTDSEKIAKKFGVYYGRYGDTFVYVTPDHLRDLSKLTLAILDIATIDDKMFYGNQSSSDSKSMMLKEPVGGMMSREEVLRPFPAPPAPAPNL